MLIRYFRSVDGRKLDDLVPYTSSVVMWVAVCFERVSNLSFCQFDE